MPDMKDVSPYSWLEKLTKSSEKERYEICWDLHTRGHVGSSARLSSVDILVLGARTICFTRVVTA